VVKIKPISPNLREKKRYLAFEVISKDKINFNQTEKQIKESVLSLIGELGYGKAGIMILKETFNNQKGLIKVNNKYVNELKMALGLIKNIDNQKVIVNPIGVSGIINKAKKRYLEVQ